MTLTGIKAEGFFSSWKSLTDMNLKYIFNNTIMLEFN